MELTQATPPAATVAEQNLHLAKGGEGPFRFQEANSRVTMCGQVLSEFAVAAMTDLRGLAGESRARARHQAVLGRLKT